MNTPSPLVPQGTSPDRGKSSLYFKILLILSVHVVLIGGMLLQGCKENKSTTSSGTGDQTAANPDTNTPPPVVENPPPLAPNTNYAPPAMTPTTSSYATTPTPPPGAPLTSPGMTSAPASVVAPMIPAPAPAPAAPGAEYVVARGDTLAGIAKKNGVSLKALMAANPGIDPRKLKIGAKLALPESATPAVAAGGVGSSGGGAAETGETSVYVVKPGDMLGRIAKAHGTTVAKIKALNDLKTSSIKVGQKLKLPGAKAPEPSTATRAPAAAAETVPASYAASQPSGGAAH